MSLERKDVRAKLDHDMHEALKAICDARGLDVGEFIESIVVREVRQVVHDAILIADRIPRSGIFGKGREKAGTQ